MQSLWRYFRKEKPAIMPELTEGMDLLEMAREINKANEANKSSHTSFVADMVSLVFFIWVLAGYFLNTPEKHLFLLDAVLVIIYNVVVFTFSATMTYLVTHNKPIASNHVNKILHDTIPVVRNIVFAMEVIIISYIIIHHFFL